jgi:nucleoid-associated protein YgaU
MRRYTLCVLLVLVALAALYAAPAARAAGATEPVAAAPTAEPATVLPAVPGAKPRAYMVRGAGQGHGPDTLTSIAQRYLGDGRRWPEIFALNRAQLRSPDVVWAGAQLRLPADAIGLPAAPTQRTHRVSAGESLWSIAGHALGDPLRWPEIFALNRGQLRSPDLLHSGTVLVLPGGGP